MARPRKAIADESLLQAALEGLTLQRDRLDEQIRQVRSMLGKRGPGRPPAKTAAASVEADEAPRKRRKRKKMSAEARKRIAEAQKKRWAAFRRKSQG